MLSWSQTLLLSSSSIRTIFLRHLSLIIQKKKELAEIVVLLGIAPDKLVRKSEDDYKTLFKGKTLSDAEWIKAMVAFPKLIERPIVVKNKKAVLGRPPENVKALF